MLTARADLPRDGEGRLAPPRSKPFCMNMMLFNHFPVVSNDDTHPTLMLQRRCNHPMRECTNKQMNRRAVERACSECAEPQTAYTLSAQTTCQSNAQVSIDPLPWKPLSLPAIRGGWASQEIDTTPTHAPTKRTPSHERRKRILRRAVAGGYRAEAQEVRELSSVTT